jgi:hypothetical protein
MCGQRAPIHNDFESRYHLQNKCLHLLDGMQHHESRHARCPRCLTTARAATG